MFNSTFHLPHPLQRFTDDSSSRLQTGNVIENKTFVILYPLTVSNPDFHPILKFQALWAGFDGYGDKYFLSQTTYVRSHGPHLSYEGSWWNLEALCLPHRHIWYFITTETWPFCAVRAAEINVHMYMYLCAENRGRGSLVRCNKIASSIIR